MRIAFYAPLKSPTHGTPSGDRRVASLLMGALAQAGHRVELASTFRSLDHNGDAARQAALREHGRAFGARLAETWRAGPAQARPELWFTYHLYYKAPDWIGPVVCDALDIPYVVAEASFAAKRADGPWAIGHAGSIDAMLRADLILCPTRHDLPGLAALLGASERLCLLPPFLDFAPYRVAVQQRDVLRAALAKAHDLDPSVPWIAVCAMMRPGDKQASYEALCRALARLADLPWQLVVAGDGAARDAIAAALQAAVPGRARLLGMLAPTEIADFYAACDLCAWPAVNEAYGMALLEAQAAGLPVVSCALRGVPDVVLEGRSAQLVAPGDDTAFAAALRALLEDPARRAAMGRAAMTFVADERTLEAAAQRIDRALVALARAGTAPV